MTPVIAAIAAALSILRTVLLAGGVLFAAIAVADWAVRTRRVNPFGGLARFLRTNVDPRLAGIERQVLRAGGHPSSTPMWAFVAYVVVAALVIALLEMVIGLVTQAFVASSLGAMGILALVIHWTFALLRLALLVRVLSSWFPRFQGSAIVRASHSATEWLLRPLRRVIPSFGMIDITPIVAYFGLQLAEWVISSVVLRGY